MAWVEELRAAAASAHAANNPSDSWNEKLRAVRGDIDRSGLERVTTERLFDVLDLPRHHRTPEAGKRLRRVMVSLGWTAVRLTAPTARGRAARVIPTVITPDRRVPTGASRLM